MPFLVYVFLGGNIGAIAQRNSRIFSLTIFTAPVDVDFGRCKHLVPMEFFPFGVWPSLHTCFLLGIRQPQHCDFFSHSSWQKVKKNLYSLQNLQNLSTHKNKKKEIFYGLEKRVNTIRRCLILYRHFLVSPLWI